MLAIVEAFRAGLLQPKNWLPNIISGLIVGVVALPLAMAFAIASGVKPEQGLYTAIIAGLCVALFGGSRTQVAGPTGAFVVILAGITAKYGVDGLQLATLLAGLMLLLMGILKIGNVIKFIPEPVIVGFTAGIGFIIFFGEWKDFFGLSIQMPLDAHFYQKLYLTFQALPSFNFQTVLLAGLSLVLMFLTPKISKKIPGSLIALICVTLLAKFFQFDQVATLGSTFGALPSKLPSLHLPEWSMSKLIELLGPAFTVALLGAIESLLSAQVADGIANTRHNSNQELIGQGIANIVAPLFGGFAATGAIARTATNVKNGGNSPLSSIVHSFFLVLVILLLAPLASYIPLCALAAILFVVAYKMSDIPHFIYILKRAPWYDSLVLVLTFFLTIFTDLVIAVNVGVVLAMLLFVFRMVQSVSVNLQTTEDLPENLLQNETNNELLIYTIQGPFFFGVTEKIEKQLHSRGVTPKAIILRLKDVPFIDITGLKKFKEVLEKYYQQGVKIYLCEANNILQQKFSRNGILKQVVGECVFGSISEAVNFISPHPTLSHEWERE